MPSDQHNAIMTKVIGLIFSLFDVASAQEMPFGIPQYVQCILQGLTSVFRSSLLTVKKHFLVVARDGFLCVTEIVCSFHSGYFDYRGALQTVLSLYCCEMS